MKKKRARTLLRELRRQIDPKDAEFMGGDSVKHALLEHYGYVEMRVLSRIAALEAMVQPKEKE